MMRLFVLAALAQESTIDLEADEEIVVYSDLFHRWDDTRWWVATEQIIPTGLSIGDPEQGGFLTFSWQVRAVVRCGLLTDKGRRRRVACKVEDASVAASTVDKWQRASDREEVDRIHQDVRAALLASKIELTVESQGGLSKIDVEGPGWLRPMVRQIMEPFDLQLNKTGFRDGGQWTTTDDRLMKLPETLSTRGNSLSVHYMNRYRGQQLIQTIGEATVAIRYDQLEDPTPEQTPSEKAAFHMAAQVPESEIEIFRTAQLNSVAILDPQTGFVSERVWNTRGVDINYWHAGRLRQLGPTEQAEVGATGQISMPAVPVEGLPLWLPVDPEVLGR